jgi:hypothetical protein
MRVPDALRRQLLCSRPPRYPQRMSIAAATPETLALRELLNAPRHEFEALLAKYNATQPRLFASIAPAVRGHIATSTSFRFNCSSRRSQNPHSLTR